MKQEKLIQTMATPHIKLIIDSDDPAIPSKTWKLCLDYRALALIEEKTKRDLKRIEAWADLSSGKDWPIIIHACCQRYNSDVTLEDVYAVMNPQAQRELSDMLFEITFPGVTEAYKRLKEREQDGETAVPNASPATQKV
jgi:hypothetical protein